MYAIEDLANFVAGFPKGTLPAEARERASLLVADLMAATAAGLESNLATSARTAATDIYGDGPAQVWLSEETLSIAGAAMANSAAASALDIDDGHRGAAGHAGAGVIPAALAVGQAINADDTEIFEAIALGYDVALRIATSRPTNTIATYASGRWGSYGAAAAAARLLALDPRQVAHALAIAGAEAPIVFSTGTSKYQGSSVKEAIPPAVTAGLTAAFRARAGATGPLDLLDNPDLFARDVLTGELGDTWWLEGCYLKPYACCRYMHAAIDAISDMRQHDKPVKSMRIEVFPQGLRLANSRTPDTLEAGQYSYYFSCALAAVHGAEALQPVDPAHLRDAAVLDLAGRIELVAHEDFADSFPRATPCRVIMDQGDGVDRRTVIHALGDVANPMSREQVTEKFRRISFASVDTAWGDEIIAALDGLSHQGFAPLFAVLKKRAALSRNAKLIHQQGG